MKNFMKSFVLASILATGLMAHGQSPRVVDGDALSHGPQLRNYVKNPSARASSTLGTATSSASIARDTDTADKLDGVASFTCDASSQGGYCEWQTYAIQEGDKTGACEASVTFKGDATLYSLQVYDGSNAVTVSPVLTNESDWREMIFLYPCGATRTVRFTQTESGTAPAVNVGRVSWRKATTVGAATVSIPWIDGGEITVVGGTKATTRVRDKFFYRRNGPNLEGMIQYKHTNNSGAAHGSGVYRFPPPAASGCVIDTAKAPGYTSTDMADARGTIGGGLGGLPGTAAGELVVYVYDSSNIAIAGNSTSLAAILPFGGTTNGGSDWYGFGNSSLNFSVEFSVPCQGWGTGSAVAPEQTNYGWKTYTPTYTGFGTVTTNYCKHRRDGEDVIIDCTFTTGTHTATEARLSLPPGLTSRADLPTLKVVGDTILRGDATAATMYPLVEASKTYITFANVNATPLTQLAKRNGDVFASTVTMSLLVRVPIEGWSDNGKAPTLNGSITTGYNGPIDVVFGAVGGSTKGSTCTSSPCTLHQPSYGFNASPVRNSQGNVTLTFAKAFSIAPLCFVTSSRSTASLDDFGTQVSTTDVLVASGHTSTANADVPFSIFCFGPRP